MAKILVVDDEKGLCRLVASILKEEGYLVIAAYDGKSALNKIKKQKYDLLILDYNLCGINGWMSGLSVLEEASKIEPTLIAIMISAFGSESIRLKARELGIYAFLSKPFDIDELVQIVRRALKEKTRRCAVLKDEHLRLTVSSAI